MTSMRTEVREYKQFINGDWVAARTGTVFESTNPFDDSVFAMIAAGTRADAADAIAAASVAQPEWAALPPTMKAAMFRRAADILDSRGDEISEALTLESGVTSRFARFQITWSTQLLRLAAGWVYTPYGQLLRSDHPHTYSTAERRPLGVVASFTPWNGAQALAWRALVLPLVAGNTVVIKPSEEAPVTAGLLIGEVMAEAGFPAGTVNVVTHARAEASEIADEFYANPAVRCLFFTGSTTTGRAVAARAAAALKQTVMELGGYNHLLVLEDADLEQAVKIATMSAFSHQGQVCMAARRILVARERYVDFVECLVAAAEALPTGDPRDPATVIGPLINDDAVAKFSSRLIAATSAGARILSGGTVDGRVASPTVVVDAPDDNVVSCEETFAPIAVVRPVDNDEEAIRLTNASPYGLSFSVLTPNIGRGVNIASQIESGAVHVNGPTIDDEPHAPNGGLKDSGWGRSGLNSLEDFTEIRWMSVETGTRDL